MFSAQMVILSVLMDLMCTTMHFVTNRPYVHMYCENRIPIRTMLTWYPVPRQTP